MPMFRSTRKGKKCFLWWASTSIWPQGVTQYRIFIKFFFDFARIFSLFSLVFRTSNFWSFRNLIKQLFHSCLLDMRLVIANSALRASLAIYDLISNALSWNNIQLSPEGEVNSGGYIPRREASRCIATALQRPWGGIVVLVFTKSDG